MNNLINFEQFNESIIGSLVIGFVTGWLIYKFMKSLEKDLMNRKEDLLIIKSFMDLIKSKDYVAISEFNDRYFIRISDPLEQRRVIDLRVFKETKELELSGKNGNSKKIPLNEQQYSKFLNIVNQAE